MQPPKTSSHLASAGLSLLLLLSPPHNAPPFVSAQTTVGCDPSCPPLGYESDSSHLCPGSPIDAVAASRAHAICHPTALDDYDNLLPPGAVVDGKLSFESFRKPGRVTVIANYYTGCEAGRRESGVYAGIAQRMYDETSGKVVFVTSLKGGGDCEAWAGTYQNDAVGMGLTPPRNVPLTVSDGSYDLRDAFFTPPYPHPSYIVLDENLEVTYKGVGPCCGYLDYDACTDDVALGLDQMLTDEIMKTYNKQLSAGGIFDVEDAAAVATDPTTTPSDDDAGSSTEGGGGACQSTTYSEWSSCSRTCGDGGIQFRYRLHSDETAQTRPCPAAVASTLPSCEEEERCVPEFGNDDQFSLTVVASGLDSPRDLAFHPTPGVHLGDYSEGRTFFPDKGEELWIANGNNHSVSIVASVGTEHQTTLSRRDRGYYHYMNNITALAFNAVGDSSRNPDQDSFNYFAVCNDNLNDYLGTKEPNYFMGPTLYDTDTVNRPGRKNTVSRAGDDCSNSPSEQCFFLHADMLHEAPGCIGIAHDPEIETAYGTVYWAFDATGDNGGDAGGHLVRFDFSQPHGPGSMDHSVAVVRRYPEVTLRRDERDPRGHAGMIVHPESRVLYVADPGRGRVAAVRVDTGRYSRTAREEYPIFSNRLPSFEYSIYECVEREEAFATGLDSPSGLALSVDGHRLFVAEKGGRILALDVESGSVLQSIDLGPSGYRSIGGLAVSPKTGDLYFVDMDRNEAVRIDPAGFDEGECEHRSYVDTTFQTERELARSRVDLECGGDSFSLTRDYSCRVDGTIPNGTLFEQVHVDTGYASDDPNVQSMAGMDEAAALLANRTDCEFDSELNFDALLLGGYYCHACLPRDRGSSCDAGGTCANVMWKGFTCDNEYHVDFDPRTSPPSLVVSSLHYDETYTEGSRLELSRGVTYRFTVRTGAGQPVYIGNPPDAPLASSSAASSLKSLSPDAGVTNGPILLTVDEYTPNCLYLKSAGTRPVTLIVGGATDCVEDLSGESTSLLPPETPSSACGISSIGRYSAVLFASLSVFLC